MEGGPSHVDLFDPKPLLTKLDGKPIPDSIGKPSQTSRGTGAQHPDGLPPQMETVRPERHVGLRLVRERRRTRGRHDGHPLLLGRRVESRRLRLPDEHRVDPGGTAVDGRLGDVRPGHGQQEPARRSWCSRTAAIRSAAAPTGIPDSCRRSTRARGSARGDTPILDLKPPAGVSDEQQRNQLGLLQKMNQIWAADKSDDTRTGRPDPLLRAGLPDAIGRIGRGGSFEGVAKPPRRCTAWTNPATAVFGTNCLMARSLVERGVRFVELY